jgi:hypothetical protein
VVLGRECFAANPGPTRTDESGRRIEADHEVKQEMDATTMIRPEARRNLTRQRLLTLTQITLALGLIALRPRPAAAARVSGSLVSYEGQQPEVSRDLHFENCVTRDSYLAPTHSDGSFAQSLPPGCYDLRAERGAILRHGIMVGDYDVAIGRVGDLAPYAPARLFDLEALFPTLLTSPAPSTAYIFTRDNTVIPANAPVLSVPSSESEWLKLQRQTEGATSGAGSNLTPAPDFNEPMNFGTPGTAVPTMP